MIEARIIKNPLAYAIKAITGKKPKRIKLYQLAVTHGSVAPTNQGGIQDSYERLEYLGDAVLGSIVAEFLYKKYPYKNEGFLTENRSKIVSRETLNKISHKMELYTIINYNPVTIPKLNSIHGDVLEALIGALYLDRGLKATKKFVINKIISPFFHFQPEEDDLTNYKSKILEKAQKENATLTFDTKEKKSNGERIFETTVVYNGKKLKKGFGKSKKKAEQNAAKNSLPTLDLVLKT